MTAQGRAELQAELDALKGKRPAIIEQIRLAAADKDVRENAPLGAAREQLGHLEGRIKELEQVLKSAGVIGKKDEAGLKVYIGDTVLLHDLASGREVRYTIVSPREVDPVRGKISSASPIGQALIGRRNGEMVEVTAPAGKLRYQVKAIER
ncbi:MAG: transcription elongation factor GreA [Chloroflexi bacterium]|nr:transcription elongation factor GreA [Chloroflexota bacterium]